MTSPAVEGLTASLLYLYVYCARASGSNVVWCNMSLASFFQMLPSSRCALPAVPHTGSIMSFIFSSIASVAILQSGFLAVAESGRRFWYRRVAGLLVTNSAFCIPAVPYQNGCVASIYKMSPVAIVILSYDLFLFLCSALV